MPFIVESPLKRLKHVSPCKPRVRLDSTLLPRTWVDCPSIVSTNDDKSFVIYQLRTSYLENIRDGVGERLITVNPAVLNNSAFRLAGWAPNAAAIKRCYSPPIPTATAAEYFQGPRNLGISSANFGEDDDEGGMVTGGGGSNDTVGPLLNTKRKRRKEQLEEDDSSDLTEDSEEDGDGSRAARQIKFNKMPLRSRAGSSPLRSTVLDGPSVLVTSPSKPGDPGHLRRSSSGAVHSNMESAPVKGNCQEGSLHGIGEASYSNSNLGRIRRDTTTSSDMSSENELDPSVFQRKQLNPRKARPAMLSERIQEEEREGDLELNDVDPSVDSDASSLSSDLAGSDDSATSILDDVGDPSMSLPTNRPGFQSTSIPQNSSPKRLRTREPPTVLQALPPPRPISIVAPVSILSQALKASSGAASDPLERFSVYAGTTETNPLYIKIYPFASSNPKKPLEIMLRRGDDKGAATAVSEAIGHALWKYDREGLEPPIAENKKNVNKWIFRMLDDGEVDDDFPPITRTRLIVDFTSNNNNFRPRLRSREKPWDEYALMEATESEFKENEKATPRYTKEANDALAVQQNPNPPVHTSQQVATGPEKVQTVPFRNPITDPSVVTPNTRKDTWPLDAPASNAPQFTMKMGPHKNLTVHFTDEQFVHRTTAIQVTADSYIAEVFDTAVKRFGVDKALYVLKVRGTLAVAPTDRTVEALGTLTALDLVRRRFISDGQFGLSGSQGSTGSPNAPLFGVGSAPKLKGMAKSGKAGAAADKKDLAALQRQEAFAAAMASTGKRFAVIRKQPMSFASSSSRIIVFDQDYMHIMPNNSATAGGFGLDPAKQDRGFFEAPQKVTSVLFANVVGSKVSRKHPRNFSFGVYRDRETKRYDFEAQSQEEAISIVDEIRKGLERSRESAL